jgi:general secretion pathway protein G
VKGWENFKKRIKRKDSEMKKEEIKKIVRKAEQGFTLIEIMVVVGIIGLLVAVLIPNVTGKMNEARIASARVQIKNVEEALVSYNMKHGGKYPDSLDVLTQETDDEDALLQGGTDDPWGNPLQYEKRGKKRPLITSGGPDGEIGTEDDITNVEKKK